MKVITQTQYSSKLTITQKTPILDKVNVELRRMEEVSSESVQDSGNDRDLIRRRAILATAFQALPTYGSAEFWSLVEEPQLNLALPLEILVKCVRVAITQED